MAARRTTATTRPSPSLQALLGLSGLLARGKPGGLLSEALALVLEGVGAQRGAAYEATEDGLELKADVGLPATLRAYIGTFPSAEVPWFPAQTAAKKRRITTEMDAATALAGRIDRELVNSAGWGTILAMPILIGRDVLGALVVATPSAEMLSPEAPFVLETAANMLALSMAHEKAQGRAAALAAEEVKPVAGALERRGADAKLARLAILGSLAAGFADEMRWPLSSLGTQLEEQEKLIGHLRVRFPGVASALDDLARIQDEATTALRFARTAGTRLLSALEDSSAEPVDLGDLAHEAAALVEPTARARNVDLLVTAVHGSSPIVVGKRSDLGQLLLSLLTNGVEACAVAAEAGTKAKAGEEPQKPLVCVTVTRDKEQVVVRVEDAGAGVPPDMRARIFDAFFTTKKESLGLGLTLARQVAVAHRGTLELDRSDLGGALLKVVLPAAPIGVSAARNHPPPPSRRKPLGSPSVPPAGPSTARDGWTSAPRAIEQKTPRKPVRAPLPVGNALVVAADTDVCAPTQRVPRTPSGGHAAQTPKVPAVVMSHRSRTAPRVDIVSSPKGYDSSQIATQKIAPKPPRTSTTPGGSVVPTARVPEAPKRAPRSRRSKESPQ
ncbi:GAF domain-containing sensor histidine kinase [Polyangium fumosum]|uniref:histidine kinase n=1 Tax=Polyangium fumosum TaxID=889272 RepID=A0A4U1J546_9BACT|nr:GAF domain-containing sensor histidine kinase [Polyangium fumosum]TKD01841.1 GAF domain-containing protein [Polyangium fumosum]